VVTRRDECWLLDLDGVLWRGDEVISGSPEAVRELRESGRRVACFTNNSFVARSELLAKFAALGYLLDDDLVFSSAAVAASLCRAGERAFVIGGPGLREALVDASVEMVALAELDKVQPDVVVVGMDPLFDYPRLAGAMRAIRAGARFIGTNDDASYPAAGGLIPGAGAILAAIACAAGVAPMVAGKPNPPTVELLRRSLGEVAAVVGDRPSTDGVLAQQLGARFFLVRSGVTAPGVLVEGVPVDRDERDLLSLVRRDAR
jgi:4-nitrophenyl phosphatase